MIVTIDQVQNSLIKFIKSEIAAKANDMGKFAISFMGPSISRKAVNMIGQIKVSGTMPELFDDNGNIQLEEVYTRAKEAIGEVGKVRIPMLGYNIDSNDIEVFYNILKNSTL